MSLTTLYRLLWMGYFLSHPKRLILQQQSPYFDWTQFKTDELNVSAWCSPKWKKLRRKVWIGVSFAEQCGNNADASSMLPKRRSLYRKGLWKTSNICWCCKNENVMTGLFKMFVTYVKDFPLTNVVVWLEEVRLLLQRASFFMKAWIYTLKWMLCTEEPSREAN